MCSLCFEYERKVGLFKRALTNSLDQLSVDRIGLALKELKANQPQCRESWPAGHRVARTDSDELGTIVEAGKTIKVQWDSGASSYYTSRMPANIRLYSDE